VNILMLAWSDWAGWGYKMKKAVEGLGHVARLVDFSPPYYTEYPHDLHKPTVQQVGELVDWADVIVAFDNGDTLIPVDRDWKPVLQIYHGTWFRQRPEPVVKRAKRRGYVTACTTHDLTRWGPVWLPVAMEDLSDLRKPDDEFTVVHAPTKRDVRGTEEIIKACEEAGVKLDLIERVSNADCLKRKARGHLYIDQAKSGAGLGYGVNVVEAWALGLPVVNYSRPEIEERIIESVGGLPFCPATDDLVAIITRFRDDEDFRREWTAKGRNVWATFHSPNHAAETFIEACDRALEEGHPPTPLKISVTMIVRNEEECLQTALDSTKGLADEVVVVDTGSSDNTVKIAKAFGAKVILGGDRMDKAGSRNKAIQEATGDWVVVLDADERIAEPEKVREHINQTYADGLMIRTTYMNKDQHDLSFYQQRCWRKGAFWYKYRAHELPLPSEGRKAVERVPYVWEHRPPKDRWGWKTKYALERLLLDVAENPDDPRPVYYLGRQYRYMAGLDEFKDKADHYDNLAIATLEKYLQMLGDRVAWDRPNACFDLALLYEKRKQFTDRIKVLHEACRSQPTNKRWWAELARAYWDAGLHELGLGLFKATLELPSEKQEGYILPGLDGPYIYDRASMWCWHMGRWQEGREYAKEALARTPPDTPDHKRIIQNIKHFDQRLKGGGNV